MVDGPLGARGRVVENAVRVRGFGSIVGSVSFSSKDSKKVLKGSLVGK